MSSEPLDHHKIEKAILKSQHCQRNWDLSKDIPQEDMDLLVTAVSQCPSKQNVAYYKAHFITNRELIEKVHDCTDGFTVNYETNESVTNSQSLANLLVVLEEVDLLENAQVDPLRNTQTNSVSKEGEKSADLSVMQRDQNMAVGIAAGYLNISAALMGYATGCCLCFNGGQVKNILGLKKKPLLLMGIGHKDPSLGRRVHHLNHEFVFPTKHKQKIEVSIVQ